jgi:ribonuclease HI
MRADNLPVSNKDLIRRLEREMRSRSLRPKLIWARGQSHGKGNNMADE